jgi:hypothetical protein
MSRPHKGFKRLLVYASIDCKETHYFDVYFTPRTKNFSLWELLFIEYPQSTQLNPITFKQQCETLKNVLDLVQSKMPGVSFNEWKRNGMALMLEANMHGGKFAYAVIDEDDQ